MPVFNSREFIALPSGWQQYLHDIFRIDTMISKIKFPLWQYLNQPLFDDKTELILNPCRFQHTYRVQLLESCWHQKCYSKKHYC